MILTYFVSMIHDSASTPDILVKVLTGEFMRKNYASSCLLSGELKLFVIVSFFTFRVLLWRRYKMNSSVKQSWCDGLFIWFLVEGNVALSQQESMIPGVQQLRRLWPHFLRFESSGWRVYLSIFISRHVFYKNKAITLSELCLHFRFRYFRIRNRLI